jgi:pimeloyl-ACP methyl ester carboxylesterase
MTKQITLEHRPVFFPAGDNQVFGIFTPAPEPKGPAVVILSGGLHGTSTVGRNRLFLRMAERLAAAGYHALRFDYHGIGESTGLAASFGSDAPFARDAVAAVRWLESQGIDETVLLGKCFGSRLAWAAAREVEGLRAMVVVDSPMRHFGKGERQITKHANAGLIDLARRTLRLHTLRGFLDPRRRASYALIVRAKVRALRNRLARSSATAPDAPGMDGVSRSLITSFENLVERQVPVLFLYGTDDRAYGEFQHARSGRLGQLIERGGSRVEVRTIAGTVTGFAYVDIQDTVISNIDDWLRSTL